MESGMNDSTTPSTDVLDFGQKFAVGFVLAHIPFFLVIALIVFLCCYCYKRRKRLSVTKDSLCVSNVASGSMQAERQCSPEQQIKEPLPPIPGTEVITFKLKEDPKEDPGYEVIADSFLTKADVDSGYVVAGSLNDPSNRTSQLYNRYTVTAEDLNIQETKRTDEDPDDHDYEEPFWEPATKEEELLLQLDNLKVKRILSESVRILEILGRGQFGAVNKALWQFKNCDRLEVSQEVAVKSLHDESSNEDKVKFLQEAAIMAQFNQPNILRVLGIINENEHKLGIVVDLMDGDLRQHLAALREDFDTSRQSGELAQTLLSYSRQVASGIAYLHFKKYVHRDLAARNVLVSVDGICKIADFGLSRDLRQDDYYRSHGGKVPVKWTAPEAIHYHKYSTASDVWSYGCLLYEIWSIGEKPFNDRSNAEAIKSVGVGYRLPPPPGCPKTIYSVMTNCWHPSPELRPAAPDIAVGLQRPDYQILKWSADEIARYDVATRTLGSPLTKGCSLHLNLQRKYLITSNEADEAQSTSAPEPAVVIKTNTTEDDDSGYI